MHAFANRDPLVLLVAVLAGACGGGVPGEGNAVSSTVALTATAAPAAHAKSTSAVMDIYVASTGSDSDPGTAAAPVQTIARASQLAVPGTTVHVAPGIYPGSFETSASGTSPARIRYVSDVKWAARIVPPANSESVFAWHNTGNYVDIEGFEVDGTDIQNGQKWWTGIYTTGSYNVIKNNHVHDIATSADTCTDDGGSGINSDNAYGAVNNDVIANVVHSIGSIGCNGIHGLYIVASGNVKNNLVYDIGFAGIHSWHAASSIVIANNTVFNTRIGILVGGDLPDKFRVSNNIVVRTRQGIVEQSASLAYGTNTFTDNLVYQSRTPLGLYNVATGTINADPQFISAETGDFRLKATSPAIGKGSLADAPADDFLGTMRPLDKNVDLGAFQYTGN